MKGPVIAVILDGWGISKNTKNNAIKLADTPIFDHAWKHYPHSKLETFGENVGLPKGLAGNSEVGHINLGAGRIMKQDLTEIDEAIEDGSFFQNGTLLSAMQHAKANGSNLHLMGLISDSGVHSSLHHLFAILKLAKDQGIKEVYIHGFTDGRDSPPKSAIKFISQINKQLKKIGIGKFASISGRYYAMDRAHNYERIKLVYDLMVKGIGKRAHSAEQAIKDAYKKEITDEYIEPTVILRDHKPWPRINDYDIVIFFNLRSDRARQLTKPFVLQDFPFFKKRKKLDNLYFVGLTNFGEDLPMSTAFPDAKIKNSLVEVISKANKKQLLISEEEKFAHVAYFFHGGTSIPYKNVKKTMLKSVDIEKFVDFPQMNAEGITKAVVKNIKSKKPADFILLNYPNCDVLGHSGSIKAAIQGIEFIDKMLDQIIKAVLAKNGSAVITADHGNAEEMLSEDNKVLTEHSKNDVPFIIASKDKSIKSCKNGILADFAPTILEIMGIKKPKEMTGKSLIRR